jgi:hypothetical protein
MRRLKLCPILIGAFMLGCAPTLDWREVRPEGGGALVLFPCKPRSQARITALAGSGVVMTMLACDVAGMTFALSHAELGDPSRVTPALVELRSALAANVGASDVRSAAFELAGMTPNPQAMRIRFAGHLPDGAPVQEQAALFVRGTRIYQVAVLGARLDMAATSVFFESLRLTE